jgi:hypothetical protein
MLAARYLYDTSVLYWLQVLRVNKVSYIGCNTYALLKCPTLGARPKYVSSVLYWIQDLVLLKCPTLATRPACYSSVLYWLQDLCMIQVSYIGCKNYV